MLQSSTKSTNLVFLSLALRELSKIACISKRTLPNYIPDYVTLFSFLGAQSVTPEKVFRSLGWWWNLSQDSKYQFRNPVTGSLHKLLPHTYRKRCKNKNHFSSRSFWQGLQGFCCLLSPDIEPCTNIIQGILAVATV